MATRREPKAGQFLGFLFASVTDIHVYFVYIIFYFIFLFLISLIIFVFNNVIHFLF